MWMTRRPKRIPQSRCSAIFGGAKKIDELWTSAYLKRGEDLFEKEKDEEANAQFALALQRDAGADVKID
jgi:hypothetical protein